VLLVSRMFLNSGVARSSYLCDTLEVIEDAPICNAGVIRDLTQCGDAEYIIFVLLSFSLRRF